MRANSFIQFWRVFQHLAANCGVVYPNASVCHHLLQISIQHCIAAVPAHVQQDDFGEIVSPLKEIGSHHWVQAKEKFALRWYAQFLFLRRNHWSSAQNFRGTMEARTCSKCFSSSLCLSQSPVVTCFSLGNVPRTRIQWGWVRSITFLWGVWEE